MRVKKYYITGNTAQGQIDLLSTNIKGMKKIELHHPSYKFNTGLLEKIIDAYKEKTTIEVLQSPISKQFIEGIILRDLQVAIIAPKPPLAIQAYESFAQGLRIHDDLEQIYIKEMDFKKADDAAEQLIHKLLINAPKYNRTAEKVERFFGTNTMDGIVNEVPHIISNLDMIYHIKGRAGTGKSTFMKKIASACLDQGLDIELYHCSFDSGSIDMVLVPDLKICLFDSTDPHEFHPKDANREQIIDLYDIAVNPGTDERYREEIATLTKRYKSFMKKGLVELKQQYGEISEKEATFYFSDSEFDKAKEEVQRKINS